MSKPQSFASSSASDNGPQLDLAGRLARLVAVAAIGLATSSAGLSVAEAAADVQGDPSAVQLRAENASTREVLDALAAKFGLKYKLSVHIGREVGGSYSGTLRQVLARVLDGTDYVVQVNEDGVKVIVFGASGLTAVAANGQATGLPQGGASSSAAPPAASAATITPTAVAPVSVASMPAATPILPATTTPPPLQAYLSANTP
jgi:hypothetical protein